MNRDTKIYLKKKFKEHYWNNKVPAPEDVGGREFGFGTLEKKIAVRHISFKNEEEMRNYLKREAPYYISYSTAYYEFPDKQPMEAKNWLGADLVFDIDIPMEFLNREALDKAKGEAFKLVDFMVSDFGFPKKDMAINFSGSKGYHIHISTPAVLKLGGQERRGIVDYVSAEGLAFDDLNVNSSWVKRIKGELTAFIGDSDASDFMEIDGIGEKTAGRLYEKKADLLAQIDRGRFEGFSGVRENVLNRILDKLKVPFAGETDKMVTIDVHRLIRLPESIHGSSGLRAAKVKDLDKFDPLVDALAFGDEKVKIEATKKVPRFELGGEKIGPIGGEASVPEFAAVYLMLKDAAEIKN
ncbi:MAG: hypothetical protein MSIBF_03680 [Candidatus Altiarchaeales archaeon IMC4]|nr:MAG: hypothetical protein MSIBF_03680 [Candidatus Altiarchaeales archaeon IMC4]